jgi:hypothetical protein
VTYYRYGVASKRQPKKKGVLCSVYFPSRAAMNLVREAAKRKGVRMSAFMRAACLEAAERAMRMSTLMRRARSEAGKRVNKGKADGK